MNAKTANTLLALQSVKSDTIDRVLEIIDTVNDDLDFGTKEKGVALSIKEKVLALKGKQG